MTLGAPLCRVLANLKLLLEGGVHDDAQGGCRYNKLHLCRIAWICAGLHGFVQDCMDCAGLHGFVQAPFLSLTHNCSATDFGLVEVFSEQTRR